MNHRYAKFISSRPARKFVLNSGLERHHIIPKAVSPDLKHDPNNIIVLTCREHYICHWMLAKIYGGRQWYAFMMMKRVIKGTVKNSVLFAAAKKYLSQAAIENPIEWSTEMRLKYSERLRDTVCVKHKDDFSKVKRMAVTDERYISGEYVHNCQGNIKTEEQRRHHVLTCGVTGKRPFVNEEENIVRYFGPEDIIPSGFVRGRLTEYTTRMRETMLGMHFYYNPETNKQIRVKVGQIPPEGFVRGKLQGFQSGLASMNDSNRIKLFDLDDATFKMVDRLEYTKNKRLINTPGNAYCVIIKNYLIDCCQTSRLLLRFLPNITQNSVNKIIKTHHNCRKETSEFTLLHSGKQMSELGISVIRISEYTPKIGQGKIILRKEDIEKYNTNDIRRAFSLQV